MDKKSLKGDGLKKPGLPGMIEEKEIGTEQNTLNINCPIKKFF